MLGAQVTSLRADRAILASGEAVLGTAIVDARGPMPPATGGREGYQKFVGLEIALERAHGLELPILMDATVDQSAGYRFCYVLPLEANTVLVEDTYLNNSSQLDRERLRTELLNYVARQGWKVEAIRREESGVLPMPWAGRPEPPRHGPLVAGYGGGWFHPGTGYSFPVAARLADFIARRPPEALFGSQLIRFARGHRSQASFAQFLNRLQFRWYPPPARRAIYERFYRLPDSTIRNFYALRLGWRDRLRLLVGAPPRGLSLRYRLNPTSE
jgi:lycopene beta-cyclase